LTLARVDIRPGVSVLALLEGLNHGPWYALGEFVDNSVESFGKHRAALRVIKGASVELKVDIIGDVTLLPNIQNNAAGISESEYTRAFRPDGGRSLSNSSRSLCRLSRSEVVVQLTQSSCCFLQPLRGRRFFIGYPLGRAS
jgi:hypothetical protein